MRTVVGRLILAGVLALFLSGLGQAQPPSISGFGDVLGFSVNGTGGISGGTLTLTNNNLGDNTSAFYRAKQDITSFTAQFIYTVGGDKAADGAAFVIHNDPRGLAAIGDPGSRLAYGTGGGHAAIAPSVALEFNIFDHNTHGIAVATNGSFGTYISTAPVVLESGDPIQVNVGYFGGILGVILRDTVTGDTFIDTFTIDIPTTVGSPFAWVGFTGADGALFSTQTISAFSYEPFAEALLYTLDFSD
jgi:hypothetical protein